MTPQEFKDWFDGYTDAMGDEPPTAQQWKRIQDRVRKIDGLPAPHMVFVDRYWGRYDRPWYVPYAGTGVARAQNSAQQSALQGVVHAQYSNVGAYVLPTGDAVAKFDPAIAFANLGHAEALEDARGAS